MPGQITIAEKARKLRANKENVISFATGEPDFPTPEVIKAVGIREIQQNNTKYSANPGIPELRKAICEKFKKENGIIYETPEVMVSNGAKQAIFEAFGALLDPGDEVIVPTPCWVSYVEQAKIFGGIIRYVPTKEENNFRIEADAIQAAITSRTKAILINSPNNPSGAIIPEEELRKLGDIAVKNDLFVISDEVYEKLIYTGDKYISIASLSEDIKKHTITINSMSKSYCMTGWRVGYTGADRTVIKAMSSIQSHMTGGVCGFNQKAAAFALENYHDFQPLIDEYTRRRETMVSMLRKIPGITCNSPDGAFYVFPNVQEYFGKSDGERTIDSSMSLAEYLIDTAKVACVAGEAFGMPGYLRFTYAIAYDLIIEGICRVEGALSKLK